MIPARAWLPAALALLLALTAFAVPAAAQPATVPTWQVGQEVGYGLTVPLGQELTTLLTASSSYLSLVNITHLNYFNATGSLDSWVDQQVTMKTDSAYILHTVSASGIKLHLVLNATFNNLPQAGTYAGIRIGDNCTLPVFPTKTDASNVTLDLTGLTTSDGRTSYAISTLAIQNDTTNSTTQLRASASLVNVPSFGFDNTTCAVTVAYPSRDLGLTVDTQNGLSTLFSPALDVFNFPITDNETWWANSTATFAGTETGTIDVTGLSAQDEQAFFENVSQVLGGIPLLSVTGLDHFPIDLSQVAIVYGGVNVFNHGQIHETNPVPVNLELQATQVSQFLSDNQFHEVFEIYPAMAPGVCGTTIAALYSPTYPAPNQGMIVGFSALLCPGPSQLPIFEFPNVPPSTARGNIQKTKTDYSVVPPAQGNAIADFFLQAPYWGLLILVVAVAAIVALLVMRRRRRPARASPAAGQAQTPPPPPP